MKKTLIFLSFLISSIGLAQEYKTGDSELDASLKKVQTEAEKDLASFKKSIADKYHVLTEKVENCFKAGMNAADAVMAFEIASITKKPIDQVIVVYQTNKTKGWGAMAKELGIKPGSAEFHALKNNSKSTTSTTLSTNPGKGKSKKNGNNHGKSQSHH